MVGVRCVDLPAERAVLITYLCMLHIALQLGQMGDGVDGVPAGEWDCSTSHKRKHGVCRQCGLCKRFCCPHQPGGRRQPATAMQRDQWNKKVSGNVGAEGAVDDAEGAVVSEVAHGVLPESPDVETVDNVESVNVPVDCGACHVARCTLLEHLAKGLCVRHCGCEIGGQRHVERVQPRRQAKVLDADVYVDAKPVVVAMVEKAVEHVVFSEYGMAGLAGMSVAERNSKLLAAARRADELRDCDDVRRLDRNDRPRVMQAVGTVILGVIQQCVPNDTVGCYLLIRHWLDREFGVGEDDREPKHLLRRLIECLRIAIRGLPFKSEGSEAIAAAIAMAGTDMYNRVFRRSDDDSADCDGLDSDSATNDSDCEDRSAGSSSSSSSSDGSGISDGDSDTDSDGALDQAVPQDNTHGAAAPAGVVRKRVFRATRRRRTGLVCTLLHRFDGHRQNRRARQNSFRLQGGLPMLHSKRHVQQLRYQAVSRVVDFCYQPENTVILAYGSLDLTHDGKAVVASARHRRWSISKLFDAYRTWSDASGADADDLVGRTAFYQVVGAVTLRDLKVLQ